MIPPLVSTKNSLSPFHLPFSSFAAPCNDSPTILSSITMFAPASIASWASATFWHSTLIRSEKPATRRTALIAAVMEPAP